MKAVYCTKYGSPEVLKFKEIEKPIPGEHEILVKIISTIVNSGDVRVRGLVVSGLMKILMLFVLGFKKPRKPILGNVFSGVVESMGAKVSQFKLGDHVFGITGFKFGTYAEYLTIPENGTLTKMPVNASFDEAASLVFGGHTAAYFLNKMNIANTSNADILIIGATGSVGTSAIQIARYYGAKVTAVCSSNGKSIVENLGITDMIFYDKEDFLQHPKHFDLIFDAVGKTTKKQCKKILKKGGVYKTVGGWEMATESKKQLEFLKRMFEQGSLKAVIDRKYPFDEMVEAHRYVDTGRKKGNVVIQMVE